MRSRYRCSMCPAIHINSRSWLRSSSTHEPSDPPPRVFVSFRNCVASTAAGIERGFDRTGRADGDQRGLSNRRVVVRMRRRATRARATDDGSLNLAKTAGYDRYPRQHASASPFVCVSTERRRPRSRERGPARPRRDCSVTVSPARCSVEPATIVRVRQQLSDLLCSKFDNDPSAGSPTETLLRLLLPLDDQV